MDWSNPVDAIVQKIKEIEGKFDERNLATDFGNDHSRLERMKNNEINQFFQHMPSSDAMLKKLPPLTASELISYNRCKRLMDVSVEFVLTGDSNSHEIIQKALFSLALSKNTKDHLHIYGLSKFEIWIKNWRKESVLTH